MNGIRRAFLFALSLGAFALTELQSQESSAAARIPINLVVPATAADLANATDPLTAVIVDALRQDLVRRGFEPRLVVAGSAPETRELTDRSSGSAQSVPRYALSVDTKRAGSRILIRLSWSDEVAGTITATAEREGPADLTLDRTAFLALRDLVGRVGPIERPAPTERTEKIESTPTPSVPPVSVPIPDVGAPPGADSGTHEDKDNAGPPSSAPSVPVRRDNSPVPAPHGGLELGIAVAPFIAAGSLSAFFRLSGIAETRLAYRFPGESMDFAIGVLAASVVFQAEGPLDSATGVFAPLAVEIRLSGPQRPRTFSGYLRLIGGAALFYVNTGTAGSRTSFLPVFGGGIGLAYTFDGNAAISLDLLSSVFLDGTDLIAGFNPGIEISFPIGVRR